MYCSFFLAEMFRFAVLILMLLGVATFMGTTCGAVTHGLLHRRSVNLPVPTDSSPGNRPGQCSDYDHYVHCYLCGKVADSQRVYYSCCDGEPAVLEFCQRLLE